MYGHQRPLFFFLNRANANKTKGNFSDEMPWQQWISTVSISWRGTAALMGDKMDFIRSRDIGGGQVTQGLQVSLSASANTESKDLCYVLVRLNKTFFGEEMNLLWNPSTMEVWYDTYLLCVKVICSLICLMSLLEVLELKFEPQCSFLRRSDV